MNQKKDGYRFVADNTGEVTPFDWYNSRISVDFKVVLAANGGNIGAEDHNGMVNGSHSLINNFKVNLNGRKVYDLNISKIFWSIVIIMLKQRLLMNSSF